MSAWRLKRTSTTPGLLPDRWLIVFVITFVLVDALAGREQSATVGETARYREGIDRLSQARRVGVGDRCHFKARKARQRLNAGPALEAAADDGN